MEENVGSPRVLTVDYQNISQLRAAVELAHNTQVNHSGDKLFKTNITQQTRYTDPMLVLCWASVADDGPALNQHWVTAV